MKHGIRLLLVASVLLVAGCMPALIKLKLPDGSTLEMSFYPGGQTLDDLLIINGKNYFGKAQFQMDDPEGDIGFRLNDGQRVQAECIEMGKDIIGQPECKHYQVYRSNFPLIPVGARAPRPAMH